MDEHGLPGGPFAEPLLPKHGGYRKLKSFQLARLIYDLTVPFVEQFIERGSRTRDQMVQAARSGVQNIGEGSEFSATSKKLELKLTNAARSSLEELKLDYEDYLRHRQLPVWPPDHPALQRFKRQRYERVDEIFAWAKAEVERAIRNLEQRQKTGVPPVHARPCLSIPLANGALSLLNLTCHLLERQVQSQADAFEREGGFTERLHRVRNAKRRTK